MKSSRKSILVFGVCLAAWLLGSQTQAYGDSIASVTFWHGMDTTTYIDQHASFAEETQTDSVHNLSGAAAATVRGSTSLGASATASDGQSNDGYAVSSHSEALRILHLKVTSPGIISYDLSLGGSLNVQGTPVAGYSNSSVGAVMEFSSRLSAGEIVPGTNWAGTGKINIQNGQWRYITTGALGDGQELGKTSATINASTLITATLTGGDYFFVMQLEALVNDTDTAPGTTFSGTSDFFNSFGFGGTNVDFWDIVGGTASFYDVDDPSKHYSGVPLPGALVLLGAGLVRLLRYGRRKQGFTCS